MHTTMKATPLILLSILLAGGAFAAELDQAAAAVAGSEASFTQHFTPKGFSTSTPESGSVVFGPLPMMRWSYASPEEKLFVFDGHRSWFYVPADKQVTVADVDDTRRAELPFLLIGDPGSRARLFNVTETTRGTSIVTTLQPKSDTAQIRSVVITTAAATHAIERIEYTDREGNRTSFDFSGFHRRPTPAELFHFTAPAGVQVVQAQ
jgi:outer membrane lipoprotein carrier protein